jgi:hypothetical protein
MPFNTVAAVADAVEQGRQHIQHFYRAALPNPGANLLFGDASVAPGIPTYNAYLGNALEATPMIGQRNASIYVGPALTTQERYLLSLSLMEVGATAFLPTALFLDYLLSYAYIDLDSTDQQDLTNTEPLPRYTNGDGVRAMLVQQTPGAVVSANVTMTYTNTQGVSQTVVAAARSSATIGVLASANTTATTATGIFLPLASGDLGVQSVQSVQLDVGIGGFAVLVLVKPLVMLAGAQVGATIEKNFLREQAALPRIYEGAFLNYVYTLSGSTANNGPIIGQAQFIWTE